MAFVFDASFFPVGILLVIAISLQMSYKNAKSTQSHTHKKSRTEMAQLPILFVQLRRIRVKQKHSVSPI